MGCIHPHPSPSFSPGVSSPAHSAPRLPLAGLQLPPAPTAGLDGGVRSREGPGLLSEKAAALTVGRAPHRPASQIGIHWEPGQALGSGSTEAAGEPGRVGPVGGQGLGHDGGSRGGEGPVCIWVSLLVARAHAWVMRPAGPWGQPCSRTGCQAGWVQSRAPRTQASSSQACLSVRKPEGPGEQETARAA